MWPCRRSTARDSGRYFANVAKSSARPKRSNAMPLRSTPGRRRPWRPCTSRSARASGALQARSLDGNFIPRKAPESRPTVTTASICATRFASGRRGWRRELPVSHALSRNPRAVARATLLTLHPAPSRAETEGDRAVLAPQRVRARVAVPTQYLPNSTSPLVFRLRLSRRSNPGLFRRTPS